MCKSKYIILSYVECQLITAYKFKIEKEIGFLSRIFSIIPLEAQMNFRSFFIDPNYEAADPESIWLNVYEVRMEQYHSVVLLSQVTTAFMDIRRYKKPPIPVILKIIGRRFYSWGNIKMLRLKRWTCLFTARRGKDNYSFRSSSIIAERLPYNERQFKAISETTSLPPGICFMRLKIETSSSI